MDVIIHDDRSIQSVPGPIEMSQGGEDDGSLFMGERRLMSREAPGYKVGCRICPPVWKPPPIDVK
jgi:hypothetical protein